MTTKLLAISGSLRSGSFTTSVARAAAALAPEGCSLEVAEGALLRDLPHYDQDADTDSTPVPPAAAALRARLAAADGVLFVSPEYNYGIPGGLKNLVDWASRPFGKHCLMGKPVAVVGTSPGSRGGRASVEYLRMVLPALGATLVGDEVMLPAIGDSIDVTTDTPSDELAATLRATLDALVAAATAAPVAD